VVNKEPLNGDEVLALTFKISSIFIEREPFIKTTVSWVRRGLSADTRILARIVLGIFTEPSLAAADKVAKSEEIIKRSGLCFLASIEMQSFASGPNSFISPNTNIRVLLEKTVS